MRATVNWFVWKDGRRVGPLSDEQLHALVEAGEVGMGHVVCPEGSAAWTPLGLVPGFAADAVGEPLPAEASTPAPAARTAEAGLRTARLAPPRPFVARHAAVVVALIVLLIVLPAALWMRLRRPAEERRTASPEASPIGKYEVRVLRDGAELEVNGFIAPGLADAVKAALDLHPDAGLLHLNSDGGRVAEARRLRDVIASHNLSTYTANRCVSACVLAFLAGQRRLIAEDAKIGFHQYSATGLSDAARVAEMEKDKRYFLSRGVTPAFAQRAFARTDALWYPSAEEMRAGGFITGLAGSNDAALSGLPADGVETVDRLLHEDPLYATIAQHYPSVFQQLAAAVKEGFQQGRTVEEVRLRTVPLLKDLYERSLPYGSDHALIAVARLMVDEMSTLYRLDPAKCAAYLQPVENIHIDFRPDLGPVLVRKEMAVMSDVIRTAATRTWTPPGEDELAPIRTRVVSKLLLAWPREDLEVLTQLQRGPGRDPAQTCRVSMAFYKTMADLPPEEAGIILRSTFAPLAR